MKKNDWAQRDWKERILPFAVTIVGVYFFMFRGETMYKIAGLVLIFLGVGILIYIQHKQLKSGKFVKRGMMIYPKDYAEYMDKKKARKKKK